MFARKTNGHSSEDANENPKNMKVREKI